MAPPSSTSVPSTSTQPQRRVGACNNCYLRKTRCDQGKPCKTCTAQGLQASCSGGLRRQQQQQQQRRVTGAQARRVSTSGATTTASSGNHKACVGCVRRKSRCDLGTPCGTCVRLGVAHTCRRRSGEKADDVQAQRAAAVEAIIVAAQQQQPQQQQRLPAIASSSLLAPSRSAVRVLAPAQDVLAALDCFGNVSIASRWPAMDELLFHQIKATIAHDGVNALSDMHLAFVYAVLAFSCHTVIYIHPLRQTGQTLDRTMMKRYIDEVERFLSAYKCDSPDAAGAQGSPEPILDGSRTFQGTPTVLCRIHFFLAWTYIHTRRLKRAHAHIGAAVHVGMRSGMYNAVRHADALDGDVLTMEANRKLLVVELDMADVSLCLATGTPSSVPPLPADVVDFLTNLIHNSPVHSRAWRVWLLHMAHWARRIAAFVKSTDAFGFASIAHDGDGTYDDDDALQRTTARRTAPHRSVSSTRSNSMPASRADVALALLSEMECAEQTIFVPDEFPPPMHVDESFGSTAYLAVALSKTTPAPLVHVDNDALVAGMREIALSVRYLTLLLKAMLTAGSLDAAPTQQLNLPLCSVALRTAHDILAGVPLVLAHARSPWASLFMVDWVVGVIDVGAGIVLSGARRMHDLPSQHLVHSVQRLFDVFPNVFDVLNAHCAATPMSLQVATMTKRVAVPRQVWSIVSDHEAAAAAAAAAEEQERLLRQTL